jgi:hypothetical protein
MTNEEGMKLIKVLQSAYPRQEFEDDMIRVYTRMLADLPYNIAQQAVMSLISTSKWLPTIAEIREAAVNTACPIPHVEDAYEKARWAVRRGDSSDIHPLIRQTINAMGGIEYMGRNEMPEPMWHEWRRMYTAMREREADHLATKQGAIAQAARLAIEGKTA